MKYNLHCGQRGRTDYDNYDTRLGFVKPDGDIKPSFDNYLFKNQEPNTVTEIVANKGCLESIERKNLKATLDRWSQLLVAGGTLKLTVYDVYLTTNQFIHNQITLVDFEDICLESKSVHCYREVEELLKATSFQVEQVYYPDKLIYVSAKKRISE